ncbi:MAG TPA: transglycosylase SLT domain-containing protein [Blastocatellia bacterium]|nr:transglycosylase SLT domain-containing protein [Blastocatellia bacterium]
MLILLTVIVFASLLIWLSQHISRRVGFSATGGLGVALSVLVIAIVFIGADWSAAADSAPADRVLSAAARIGVTGLLFAAGTRLKGDFTAPAIRQAAIVVSVNLVLAATLAGCAVSVLGFDRGEAVAIAAAVIAASVWLPTHVRAIAGPFSEAAARCSPLLCGVLLGTIHIAGALSATRGGSASSHAVSLAYEFVKLVVFFSLAWFVATRFITRAQGKVRAVRVTAGYVLIAILIFAIAASWVGELAALAWSFVAGTVFRRTDSGREFGSRDHHAATSVFLAMSFLPVFLQSHGRVATSLTLVAISIGAVLILKTFALWFSARLAGAARTDAWRLAAAMIAPGEIGVALIGFGMTKWMIDGMGYFIGVGFGVIALLASFCRVQAVDNSESLEAGSSGVEATQAKAGATRDDATEAKARATRRGSRSKRPTSEHRSSAVGSARTSGRAALLLLAGLVMTSIGSTSAAAQTEDPVVRAMNAIERAANRAEVDANRTLAAARLVDESTEALKQGDRKRASEVLAEAERIGLSASSERRGALAELLIAAISRERSKIEPVSSLPALSIRDGAGLQPASRARLAAYGETIARILNQEKLPAELISVALIESGLNSEALSPKGARGIWQLMPATARRYGLAVEPGNDHRTQIEPATRAAARYISDLYRQFEDWRLVLAAYNWGEERVSKAIRRAGTRDFDEIARRVFVPLETRTYVPAVLAAWSRISDTRSSSKAPPEQRR